MTVFFADMSRSAQTTAEIHPEDAAELVNRLLKAMVDVLLKYEGRIDRFLGDGVLAAFAPAWEGGWAMPLEQALAYAMEEP